MDTKKWYIVLGIVVTVGFNLYLFVALIWEFFSALINDVKRHNEHNKQIKKANEEYRRSHEYKPRRYCVNCSYCKWKWHHPFGYGKNYWLMVNKTPYYCRKFKISLNYNSLLRCVSELDSEAMYEKQ